MQTIQTKLFDYGQAEIDYLKSVDEALGAAMSRLGKVERIIMPDLFTSLVYAIVGQLISAKAVHTIWERMQVRLGEISPSNIANQTADYIQSCGITMKKAVCIKSIAESIVQGEIRLEELNRLSDAEVIKQLMSLKGVGKWTAEMLLIHAMERPDVVSWGDIAIRRGMMKLYGLQDLTKEQFDTYRLRYSPYGSVASIYLWTLSME
ncbi:DNA-3-methyladenine glycosidase [Paenibacillus sp. FSL A5-0031]|uniref:DNA-3-methyladenine glycosylase family protein n=1 Tax=Paenibacillus sp. FSL A5-0031 TaxID=1920420 RepID=UPI00096DC46A|nr:DNA-3-methyladenine glycosylase [Paenibacillus sp. FSL A5-0031]OME80799.1 DNA-3-methyladenine glycosidase [Paenibacillus sp. FSL A5-0031]